MLFLTVSWLRMILVRAIFNKVILETATFYLQSLLWQKLSKESRTYFTITSKQTKSEFIKSLLLRLECLLKWLSMTIFQYLLIPTDLSSVKQLEDKYGSCFLKKLGLNLKDRMEQLVLDALIKFCKHSQ